MEWILEHQAYFLGYVTYIGFVSQIFISEFIFAMRFEKKKHFGSKIAVSAIIQITVAIIVSNIWVHAKITNIGSHMFWQITVYIIILIVSICGMRITYNEKYPALLLCVASSYAVQHFMSQVGLLTLNLANSRLHIVDMKAEIYMSAELYMNAENVLKAQGIFWLTHFFDVLVWVLVYFVIIKREREGESARLPSRKILFLSGATIMMLLILSCARDYYQYDSVPLVVITRLFSLMCCVFLLLIRGGFLEQNQLENEVETIKQLNHKQRAQYEQNRQNIELINIKCHDLKKRLEQYEDRIIGLTPEEMEEMKKTISIYDTTVKTGNETLDTILTERSLICEKQNIVFSCIADGASLSFLSTGDIYSLFANAVDNAMEAVSKLKNEKDRIISLSVRERMGMVVITVDNYYDNELMFEEGLPKTTKQNEHYHGYGMKSIQLIVNKYGGEMIVSTDDMFHLAILLPIPDWAR